MDMQRLTTNLSARIIVQFGIVLVVGLVLLAFNFDSIRPFYFEGQLTRTGLFLNGIILALFLVGLGNVLAHLIRYRREEAGIARFLRNVESFSVDYLEGIAANSVIARRHLTMKTIEKASGQINQGALAAMLGADEAIRFGLIRFINNILILTGVFGTIVALSIALLGASDLIDSASASLGGMGLVIHGMSTALSTTITAIVSYVVFGYFYTRLSDVQTHFLSGIEHITSVYMMPQYVKSESDIVTKMSQLTLSVIQAADHLKATQAVYHETALGLQESIFAYQHQIQGLGQEIESVKTILRAGFRLPTDA